MEITTIGLDLAKSVHFKMVRQLCGGCIDIHQIAGRGPASFVSPLSDFLF